MEPVSERLLARKARERQPGVRAERWAAFLAIFASAMIVGIGAFGWANQERGFTSASELAWPMAIVIGGSLAVAGCVVATRIPAGWRLIFALAMLLVASLFWRFG